MNKEIAERIAKMKAAQKPILDFENKEYKITHTTGNKLNYRIDIKRTLTPKIDAMGIDRDCYSRFESGLNQAHNVATYTVERYFKPSFRRGFAKKLSV